MSTPERGWPTQLDASMPSGYADTRTPISAGRDIASRGICSMLAAWRATRLPWMRFGLLAFIVAWAASLGASFDASVFVGRWALAFALIGQFRLWDDLADRARDRSAHPQRVLARIDDARAFVVACVAWGGANAVALYALHGPARLVGLALLVIGLGGWYRVHTGRALLHTHILLLKYPAFVLLLAASPAAPWTVALAAASLYSAICSFELLDERNGTRVHRIVLAAHGCMLTMTAWAPTFDAIGCLVALLVASMHAAACMGSVDRFRVPGRKYFPFAATVLVLVRFSFGVHA